MMILDELWYGNVSPSDCVSVDRGEYKKALADLAQIEEKVLGEATGAIKEDIERLCGAQQEMSSITDRNAFIVGVRFGVKMMIDTLCS